MSLSSYSEQIEKLTKSCNATEFKEFFENYFSKASDFEEEFNRLPLPIDKKLATELAQKIDTEYGLSKNPEYKPEESPLVDYIIEGKEADKKYKQKRLQTTAYAVQNPIPPNDNNDNNDDKEENKEKEEKIIVEDITEK